MKTSYIAITIFFTATIALVADRKNESQNNKPCVTITGADSHITELGYHRLLTSDSWTKLWQKHKGADTNKEYDSYYDPLGLPVVDFENYMVIAIFQGSRFNSAGLSAESFLENDESITIRFDDKHYQTASFSFGDGADANNGGAEKATVYGFFILPKSNKTVLLEENVQGLIGKPPVWKQRFKFNNLTK